MKLFNKKKFNTKKECYKYLCDLQKNMIKDEPDWLANLSNTAALLGMVLEDINWAGYYLFKNNELVLGPFYGKPACTHIAIGEGVCGTAAAKREVQIVDNVHEFPGHIACDSASMSEIVLPIITAEGSLCGVLDIDSPIVSRFDKDDAEGLQLFVNNLIQFIDWDSFL